jgi:predicted nucleic acid-binding protein
VLLDAGPLVAFVAADDVNHERAARLFAECAPPFRCCEAVVSEACFLVRKVHDKAAAALIALARDGLYEIAMAADQHWPNLETLLTKYDSRPMSFADACLVRCAEIWEEPRILTFDDDFRVYRWARNRRFEILQTG